MTNSFKKIPLEELVEFSIGGDWGKSPDEQLDDYVKVKVIRGTEFGNWWKDKGNNAALRQIKKSSLDKRQLKKGDLVVEVSGGGPTQPVGRVIVMDEDTLNSSEYPFVCSNFSRQIRLKKETDPEFVRLSIYLEYLSGKLDQLQTSTTNLRNLNFNNFLSQIEIPLLPFADQENLSKQLNNALSDVNSAKVKISKARSIIKKFKQSIFSASVEGRLTEDWREKNTEIEPASVQMQNIQQNRTTKSKAPFTPIATDELPNLPDKWLYVYFGNIVNDFKYGTSEKSDYSFKGTPVLRIPNIVSQKISIDNLKFLNKTESRKEYLVEEGDILIVRSNGSRDLVGKNALVKGLKGAYAYASYLIRIRPTFVHPEYMSILLNSNLVRQQLFSNAKSAAGINNINTQELSSMIVSLPPEREQNEIVKRANLYLELANKMESQIESVEQKLSKLNQAILNKVFTNIYEQS